jgi:ribosomal protein S18 acetylase RimI-like enzyme
MILIRKFTFDDEAQVVPLWHRSGLIDSEDDSILTIERKLRAQPELLLVGAIKETIIATVMAGYAGSSGWISHLAVAPEWQRLGYGRCMMKEAERRLQNLGCPDINLHIRTNNRQVLGFCERMGYQIERVLSLAKSFEARQGLPLRVAFDTRTEIAMSH